MKVKLHDLHDGNITLEVQVSKNKPIHFINMTVTELADLEGSINKAIKKYCKSHIHEEDFCCGDVCDFS